MQNKNNASQAIALYCLMVILKKESYFFRVVAYALLHFYSENSFIQLASFIVAVEIVVLATKRLVMTSTNLLVEFRKCLHVVSPDYVRLVSFQDNDNATMLLKPSIFTDVEEIKDTIGEERELQERVKRLTTELQDVYDVKKIDNGKYLVNGEQEYTLRQIKNNLAANKSKLNPEKPSKSVVDRIEYYTELLKIVTEIERTHKETLITD